MSFQKIYIFLILVLLLTTIYCTNKKIVSDRNNKQIIKIDKVRITELKFEPSLFETNHKEYITKADGKIKINFDGYEIDFDNDGNKDIVIFSTDNSLVFNTFKFFRFYKKNGNKYKIFKDIPIENIFKKQQYEYLSMEAKYCDENMFPEFLIKNTCAGSGGGEIINIVEWNGNSFVIASEIETSKWFNFEDINNDGLTEIIKEDYLGISTEVFPPGGPLLWADVYIYSSGNIIKSNEKFPNFYKKIRDENKQLLNKIQNQKSDNIISSYRKYYEEGYNKIINKCEKILKIEKTK